MRRVTLNRVMDCLAFGGLVLVVSTGFLLRYVLPPGSGRLQGTGRGYGAMERPITVLWGLTRQGWGTMHFWLSMGLMVVFALHLLLHWRWIRSSLRGGSRDASGIRVGLGIVGLLALLAVAVIPWLSPPTSVPRSQLNASATGSPSAVPEEQITSQPRGMMTLQDIADLTGVPTEYLREHLGLPHDVAPDERVGRLRRLYGFTMQDVRRVVVEYGK